MAHNIVANILRCNGTLNQNTKNTIFNINQEAGAFETPKIQMNRELKFRAWDNRRKRMMTPFITFEKHRADGLVNEKTDWHDGDDMEKEWDTSNQVNELLQYTGQKDKNLDEIYEGDIINIEAGNPYDVIEGNHIVEWVLSGWYVKRCDGVDYTDVDFNDLSLYNFSKRSLIIGDIFTRPELITRAVGG